LRVDANNVAMAPPPPQATSSSVPAADTNNADFVHIVLAPQPRDLGQADLLFAALSASAARAVRAVFGMVSIARSDYVTVRQSELSGE
jgi:hypothetical protein